MGNAQKTTVGGEDLTVNMSVRLSSAVPPLRIKKVVDSKKNNTAMKIRINKKLSRKPKNLLIT